MSKHDTTTDAPDASNAPDDTVAVVREYLEATARGREDAVTTGEIAEALDIDEDHDTNPATRRAVKHLREDGDLPIYGFSDGYCVLATEADLEDAVDRIRGDIAALNRLKQNLEANFEQYDAPDTDNSDEDDDDTTCEACGEAIDGDPWEWFSYECCHLCYEAAPPMPDPMDEFVAAGGAQA